MQLAFGEPIKLLGDPSTTQTFGLNNLPSYFPCDAACSTCSETGPSDCLSCSTASYGLYQSVCQICPPGTVEIETLCSGKNLRTFFLIFLDCPQNCQNCSSINSCDVCSAGYGVSSSQLCARSHFPFTIFL